MRLAAFSCESSCMQRSLKSLSDEASALKEQGRLGAAIRLLREGVQLYPTNAVAEHNLAAVLGDAGRAKEAETHIRRALAKGLNAPQSWMVLARALVALGEFDEARTAFETAAQLDPGLEDAHLELAQLIWMTTADSNAALQPLDQAIGKYPDMQDLRTIKTRVLMYTVSYAAAYDFAKECLQRWPHNVRLLAVAADAATMAGEIAAALDFSARLMILRPADIAAAELRIHALLAAGQANAALPLVQVMRDADPDDQHALCLQITCWRLLDDDSYKAMYDYDSLVREYRLETPSGWGSLTEYLRDLSAALRTQHKFVAHPFSNSEEGGSKLADLLTLDEPVIRAFREALTPAVDEHVNYLGVGSDPLRRRNTLQWEIDGIWSVLLASNGFHHNHVHPKAWLSSASYIDVPGDVDEGERNGWIKFGQPGIPTDPELPFEHALKPEPGLLVLFPSYMWHGTIPFKSEDSRLTIALDVVPQQLSRSE